MMVEMMLLEMMMEEQEDEHSAILDLLYSIHDVFATWKAVLAV